MRKFSITALFALFILTLIPVTANAQGFGTGMLLGLAMGGGDTKVTGGGEANVLFVLPRLTERLSSPLEVHLLATPWNDRNGLTIQERFDRTFEPDLPPGDRRFQILQVVRVMRQGEPEQFSLWISYIESTKLIPLGQLPPLPDR